MKLGWILLTLSLFHFSTFAVDNSTYAGHSNTDESAVSSSLLEISADFIPMHPHTGHYFDWGQGQNGWGYCYEWANGYVLNGGRNVYNGYCEEVHPSHFDWGRGQDGYTYCYQFTPYNIAMNEGRPVHNSYCY